MPMEHAGLIKLMEECGELTQIAAKKVAFMHTDDHPDGAGSMKVRLEDEIADVMAVCHMVIRNLKLDEDIIETRKFRKIVLFAKWQNDE